MPFDEILHPGAHPEAKCIPKIVLLVVPSVLVRNDAPKLNDRVLTIGTEHHRRRLHSRPAHLYGDQSSDVHTSQGRRSLRYQLRCLRRPGSMLSPYALVRT